MLIRELCRGRFAKSLAAWQRGRDGLRAVDRKGAQSRTRPRQLSYGQLDCLALPLFGIEDFDLEIWETPL